MGYKLFKLVVTFKQSHVFVLPHACTDGGNLSQPPNEPFRKLLASFKKVPPLTRKVDGEDCACESNQVDGAFRDATSGSEIWKQYGEAQAQVCRRELRPERNKETCEGEVLHFFHILQEPAPGRRVETKLLGIKVMMHRLMTKL